MVPFMFILATGISIGFSVLAQEADIPSYAEEIKPIEPYPPRIKSIMASSTVDINTASKIIADQDNTAAITRRLDTIIDLLKKR